MRIWHEDLIPTLCQKHLCAMWREGLGCFYIISQRKTGYSKHPQVIEFNGCLETLWKRLYYTRREMLKRGYKPKELPAFIKETKQKKYTRWQTLEEQKEVLRLKNCKCRKTLDNI